MTNAQKRAADRQAKVTAENAKSGSNKPHSDPHDNSGKHNQCKWDGNTRVSGEIVIKPPPDLLAEYKAAQEDNTVHNNKTRLIGWLTFIAVVIYAAITFALWWDQRKNFQADERAWIAVKEMKITQLVAGKVLMGEVVIVDTGRTPGVDAAFPGGIQTGKSLEDAMGQYTRLKQPFFYPAVLFPGIDQILPSSTLETLDEGQVRVIEIGALQIYLIGDIRYNDVFGNLHTTHYCGKYRFEVGRFETCGMKAD